jgi:hypothetical protein
MYLPFKTTNSKNNYLFVVATQYSLSDFWEKSHLAISLDKLGYKEITKVIEQNTEGLSKVYNRFIVEENRDKKIIFIHDDVLIDDLFFEEKLDLAFDKYDVVGLAGTKKCDLSREVPMWNIVSDPQDFVGEVAHCGDKKVWTTVFGPTDSRALLIDGLFIAVSVNKLLETNTKFDEHFDFHLYDFTFCLNCNKNKVKIGVFPIRVIHWGLGEGVNSQEFYKNAQIFKQLYK